MVSMTGKVIENFGFHAGYRTAPGASVFVARMAQCLIDSLDESSAFGRRIIAWGDSAGPDAIALRAIAGFHVLKLSGRAPALATCFPPNPTSDAELAEAVRATIADHDDFLAAYLDNPPQTNEVGRSSMILGAALLVAERHGLPIEVLEIGASAGLNLSFDRYGYELGEGRRWGGTDAPLTVASEWRGDAPPLDAPLVVAARAGCDRNPLNPASRDERLRLLSYIWADQPERLERMAAALKYAAEHPVAVERADAAGWVEHALRVPQASRTTRMLYHTVVWQYLPDETKARIARALDHAGSAATNDTPLVWFRFENDGGEGAPMDITTWPGGEKKQLGRADFHGRWVEWLSPK